ncbi:MAG: adenylate/guanylate cyclase domain-containing protein, partial [Bdellovibrionota bacterium]
SVSTMFGTCAHELKDNFGNVVSARTAEITDPGEYPIELRGKAVGRLRGPAGQGVLLKGLLEGALEAEFRALEAKHTLEAAQLLDRDLDSLLELSKLESIPLEELLHHTLRLLRAHVWVERASVFGMLDGFTLEGITGIGWTTDDWKALYSTAAGVAASTRKPYIVEDPTNDSHLKGRTGVDQVRNLVCHPIIHGTTLMGVLNLSNRVGGAFSEADSALVARFAGLASHILQKHIFKSRMQEFERTNDHLGKYLSKKVVKNVENSQELFLGGAEKKVVCLFSDIRGYTSITEGISAATLVKLLNFHFERMHAIIEKNEGTLDKIVGDLIMAVWNIPKDQPEPELLAMKAALEMQKEMIRVVIPEWQRHGVEKVGMGVGVNAGPALAGNLGSSRFMNYTVIGDAVNTAQRLEAKARSGEIWMNEELYPLVHGKLEKPVRRELDIRLKGKEQTINALVYKPLQF